MQLNIYTRNELTNADYRNKDQTLSKWRHYRATEKIIFMRTWSFLLNLFFYYKADGCGEAGIWTVYNSQCYQCINDTVSWQTARSSCQQLGADLVTIIMQGHRTLQRVWYFLLVKVYAKPLLFIKFLVTISKATVSYLLKQNGVIRYKII